MQAPEGFWEELRTAYATPGRFYHTWRHVEEVLARWQEVAQGPGWQDPKQSWLAVLFHDAVYEHADDEARSAALCRDAAWRWFQLDASRAAELIRFTASHGRNQVNDPDAAHFLDCDMAILGAEPARFAEYEADIAREYAFVDPEVFRAGRRAFLERVLEAERIFLSDFWRERLEARARANIRGVLFSSPQG